jgi:D-alanine-D-alanine ligase
MSELDNLKQYKIGILAGGTSNEREISLKSGGAVFDALSDKGLNIKLIDIKDAGSWADNLNIDIAFLALHGTFGEDGTVQRILEEKGILYTGSGPEASRMALDKISSKKKFIEQGLLTPEYIVLEDGTSLIFENIWFPCVVKPRWEGSSIGLSIVNSREEISEAITEAAKFGKEIIIEKFISGKEVTVGVLGDRALPVVEIVPEGSHYDYNAKYHSSGTRYIVPAEIDKLYTKRVQEAGIKAHKALGCEGFSRVDIRLTDDGEPYILEVNTIPGLTRRSLLPMAARAEGIDFDKLCLRILSDTVNSK